MTSILPLPPPPPQVIASHIDLLLSYGTLKRQPRTGWTNHGLNWHSKVGDVYPPLQPDTWNVCETVAEHSGRVGAMITLAIPLLTNYANDPNNNNGVNIDIGRCVTMGLVHDLAEGVTGDITPYETSKITKSEKRDRERKAMEGICGFKDGVVEDGKEFWWDVWLEYESGTTLSSILCKDCDVLDMLLQSYEYELSDPDLKLDCFWEGLGGKGGRTGITKEWGREIKRRRDNMWRDRGNGDLQC